MKTLITTLTMVVSCVLLSCNTQPAITDVDAIILFDMTDKVTAFPTTDDFVSQLNLKNQPYQQIHIKISTINDKDINNTILLTLDGETEWQSNITIRRAKIQHFTKQLQQCLTAIAHTDTSGHSIIYRAIAAQANILATSKAKRKYLIVYSNLYENSEVNFYNPATLRLVHYEPNDLQQILEKEVAIKPLTGLDISIVYHPANYQDNNHFMPIANLYKTMFQSHGGTVHINTKFLAL